MYDAVQSSTAKDKGIPNVLSYGQGQVGGDEFSDDVFLGGYEVAQYLFLTLQRLILLLRPWTKHS